MKYIGKFIDLEFSMWYVPIDLSMDLPCNYLGANHVVLYALLLSLGI